MQGGGEARPEEGAEDAGDGGDDVDEGEHGVRHAEGSFGEEHGGAADGGDAVGEQEPRCEEEQHVLEMAGVGRGAGERSPRVGKVGERGAQVGCACADV